MTGDAGLAIDARALGLAFEAVPDAQLASGAPATGSRALAAVAGAEVGVWAMTAGGMFDTEADEVFVVLDGRATVEFLDPPLPTAELVAGTIMRLAAGMRTRWTVHTPELRKVYVVGV